MSGHDFDRDLQDDHLRARLNRLVPAMPPEGAWAEVQARAQSGIGAAKTAAAKTGSSGGLSEGRLISRDGRRRSAYTYAAIAFAALVLLSGAGTGIFEAVSHLGRSDTIVIIGDDTLSPAAAGESTQTTVGAGSAGRPVTVLAADPGNSSVLYAGTSGGGASLCVSSDAGTSWELLKDFGAELAAGPKDLGQLVIDPNQPSRMYVGLGDKGRDYQLMKSIDGGVTWTPLDERAEQLWIDPSSSALYLDCANTEGGHYRSTDGGATWTALGLPEGKTVWSLVIDPHDSSVLYAKIYGGGLLRSTDGGVTWRDVTDRLPGLVETPGHLDGLGPLSLAIDPLDGSTVCALPHEANLGYVFAPFDERTSIGLTQGADLGYVSTDQGATWSRLSDSALLELKARLKAALGTSPATIRATAGFLESYARGLNAEFEPRLTETATGIAATVTTHFVIDPDDSQRICVGTDHGVFLSTDGGATWTMSNAGLPPAESGSAGTDATTPSQTGSVPTTAGAVGDTNEGGDGSAASFVLNYPMLLDSGKDMVIMTVESPSASYWRAGAFDIFTGSAWVTSQAFVVSLEPAQNGDSYVYSLPQESPTPTGQTVIESFQADSVYTNFLFVGGEPRSVDVGQDLALSTNEMRVIHSADSLGPTLAYSVTAVIPDLKPTDLVGKGSDYPEAVDRYLVLPFPRVAQIEGPDKDASWRSTVSESTPEGSEWAELYALNQKIVGDATDPYDVTLRIESYLRKSFEYSLTPPSSDYSSPYAAFLFDTRSGYCQHFAGAMALLLRYNGIPARVAAGFTSGEEDEPGTYTVSTNDAHAWVEAYFPEVGWVAFDPTPGRNLPIAGPSSTSPGFVDPFGE
jgi:transglutaminase-like putative cysteine protease